VRVGCADEPPTGGRAWAGCTGGPPLAHPRTKNRLRWQVFTFRGRFAWPDERPRKRDATLQSCDQAKLNAGSAMAKRALNMTTSNRQNLPAKAVFRAHASPAAAASGGKRAARRHVTEESPAYR